MKTKQTAQNKASETAEGSQEDGKAVTLNKHDGVRASYKVAGVSGLPKPEILCAGANLKDGRRVQFFLNRESNLIVVDIINTNGNSGREVLRMKA